MANTLSDLMSVTVPVVGQAPALIHVSASGQPVRMHRAVLTIAAGDGAGHIYPIVRMRQDDRIINIFLFHAAIGGMGDCNLGIYAAGNWREADQSVVDASALADALNINTAANDHGDSTVRVMGGGSAILPADYGKTLWELAGLSAAPSPPVQYDICLTAVSDPAAAGTIVAMILYTSDA